MMWHISKDKIKKEKAKKSVEHGIIEDSINDKVRANRDGAILCGIPWQKQNKIYGTPYNKEMIRKKH